MPDWSGTALSSAMRPACSMTSSGPPRPSFSPKGVGEAVAVFYLNEDVDVQHSLHLFPLKRKVFHKNFFHQLEKPSRNIKMTKTPWEYFALQSPKSSPFILLSQEVNSIPPDKKNTKKHVYLNKFQKVDLKAVYIRNIHLLYAKIISFLIISYSNINLSERFYILLKSDCL